MGYEFELEGQETTVLPHRDARGLVLSIDGRRCGDARLRPGEAPGESTLEIEGRRESIFIASRGDDLFIHFRGRAHHVTAIDALERARREAEPSGGAEVIRAPMPGVVISVDVEVGGLVEAGALLMTIESMKLQTAITAPHAARVGEVCVEAGANFDQGATLLRLEAAEAEDTNDEPSEETSP